MKKTADPVVARSKSGTGLVGEVMDKRFRLHSGEANALVQ
jgi:hypothetical protein